MLALEGKQLGNYDVIKRIRVGGMGAVYEGRQRTAFGRRVAIKVILGNYANDRDMRRRFAREARTIARLHHPHILPLIEFGDEHGLLYLVMPFIDGGTLTSYLRRTLPDLNDVAAIYEQLLDAVEYAHEEGLIHRDIKSSNVLMEMRRNGAPHVYLADFGLVRTSRQAEMEQAGKPIPLEQVPGTPHYMAPEQTRGIVTPATDIYALGVLLYQLLTGELPYDDEDEVRVIEMHLYDPIPSPCDHDASIPVELGEVVRTAMAKRIEDRYGSVAELREAFLMALQHIKVLPLVEEEESGEVYTPRRRFASVPLQDAPVDEPLPVVEAHYLPRVATTSIPQPPVQRNTDSVYSDRQRITDSITGKRKPLQLPVVLFTIVTLVLIVLIVMAHVLNVSLFPAGFPLLGADPDATISVTSQTQPLQNNFLLTASPNAQQPDLKTRIIPAHVLQATVTDHRSTPTSGTMSSSAVQAQGNLLLINSSQTKIVVPAGMRFATLSGVQIQTTRSVTVPPQQKGQSGALFVPAVASTPGSAGNIAAHAVNTTCCQGLAISNPQPFSGGSDAILMHTVTQADIDKVKAALTSQLEQKAWQKLQPQLASGEVMLGQPVYSSTATSDSPVGATVEQIQVQVNVTATVEVYSQKVLQQVSTQLLSMQAQQVLGSHYRLQGTPVVKAPDVIQQSKNGFVYLNVSVQGTWTYYFSPEQLDQWRTSIHGSTFASALAFLNQQPGVASVEIHLPPGADHLPSSTDQIKIVLNDK